MVRAGVQALALDSGGEQDLATIHGAVEPADVRPGDPVSAHLRLPGRADRRVPSRVWRISPLGVELVRPSELSAIGPGTPVDLTLRVGASVSDFRALPVVATARERGHDLLAVSWHRRPDPRGEKRGTPRWSCEPGYAPTGIAPSGVRYQDYVYFRVLDISSGGMQLETSLRNKFLVPGLELESTCTFPTLGQVHLGLRVVHARVVHRGTKKVLALGVTYAPRNAATAEIIGEYLLRFGGGATVQDLCADGFRIRSSGRALDFASIRGEDEYLEVLRLRRLAYVHAKKLAADTKDLDLADPYDARSRILVAKHRGRVVGTSRLMFPQSETDRLNHEDFAELPACAPPRLQVVEVFKTCTHPGYRGSDLFYTLLMHVGLNILQAGRRYAIMSATDSLAPIYERFGFRRTGTSYQHPSMRIRHHLMVLDVAGVVAGRGINPLFWNLVGGWELWRFGRTCGVVDTDPWTRVRVRLWRLLRPLSEVVRLVYERRLRARGATR